VSPATTAIAFGWRDARMRAAALGRKLRALIAASTRSRLRGETRAAPESTRDTVGTETPASFATSAMVAGRFVWAVPAAWGRESI
jgi:hypothetical protein